MRGRGMMRLLFWPLHLWRYLNEDIDGEGWPF